MHEFFFLPKRLLQSLVLDIWSCIIHGQILYHLTVIMSFKVVR